MKKKLFFLCFIMLSVISLFGFQSEDPTLGLLKKLEAYTKKYPSEKVYLHFDKPYYAAGDNIWFKAYVTDWNTGELTAMSNVLHVELINQFNNIVKKIQLPMQNGLTWGDFKLDNTLSEGNYRIRAYTRWMRNAGPTFFFDKTIKIGNSWNYNVHTRTQFSTIKKDNIDLTQANIFITDQNKRPLINKTISFTVDSIKGTHKTNTEGEIIINVPNKKGNIILNIDAEEAGKVEKVIPIALTTPEADIQFLPEGGTLLEGIKAKIAIKAVGSNGLGLKVKGTIVDQIGNHITTFETSDIGIGAFYLIPEPNKTYTAKVNGASILLQKASKSGYSLAFNRLDSTTFSAMVKISHDLMNKGDLYLVGQKNGNAFSAIKLSTANRTNEVIYEDKEFPQGIIQFTLFSPSNIPVCERLFFVSNPANTIQINLTQLKSNYQKKEKTDISLFSSINSKPTPASFSVAITNADVVIPDLENESNIMTNLLLTSDLIGYIEKANTYFLNNEKKTIEALDHLMLTQGWRKIEWKAISADEFPILTHNIEKDLEINGIITKNSASLPQTKVSLISNKDGMFKLDTISNEKGEFTFKNLAFVDSTKFIVQARTGANQKDIKIEINQYPEQKVTSNFNFIENESIVNQSIETYLQKSGLYFQGLNKQGRLSKTTMLKEVKIETNRNNLAPNSKNLNGPGNADQVIDVTQIEMANNVAKYLQGRVIGVNIQPNGQAVSSKTFKDKNFGGNIRGGGSDPIYMRIILDGNDMGTNFTLNDLYPQTIESIEVLTSLPKLAIYGSNAQVGLFIITTKKGGAQANTTNKYAPGIVTFTPNGYYVSRSFYSPKYDIEPNDKPDLRTTVFWAPNLVTDETGKIKFDYFNTDQPGNYRVVIEGLDINGNIARKTYTYTVN